MKYWEIIMKISATLDGIAALWRLRMAKADQFGLWPQSAATLDALLCMQIKSSARFSNANLGSSRAANWLDTLITVSETRRR
jgi:hypothetical protein